MVIKREDYVTPPPGVLITYKGNFSLDILYKRSKTFFDSKRYEFTEKEHTEKTKSHGNELKVRWIAEREVDDYAKFYIESIFEIWDAIKKNNIYSGDLKINVIARIELDYKKNFYKFPFLLFLYNNFLIKRKIENIYEAKIDSEYKEYCNIVKEILNISK